MNSITTGCMPKARGGPRQRLSHVLSETPVAFSRTLTVTGVSRRIRPHARGFKTRLGRAASRRHVSLVIASTTGCYSDSTSGDHWKD